MSKPGAQHADDFGGVATTRALTIDLDTHQNLLAVLVSAVDHLPGGHRAIRQALAEQSECPARRRGGRGCPALGGDVPRVHRGVLEP